MIGVARANQLVRRDELSPSVVRRMKSYFDRHAVDLEAPKNKDPDADGYPGAGLIAWYLWGGDEGQRWSARKVAQMNAIDERQEKRAEPDELEIGDFVNWNTEKGKYLGRVVSIRFEGSTMVGDEEVEASPDDPVARIRVFARVEEDLVETDRYVAFPFSRLTKAPAPEDYRQERQLSEEVETALEKKREEHNEEVGSDRRKRTNIAALRKVFERGIGAYKTNPSSVRPTVGNAEAWAYSRIQERSARHRSSPCCSSIINQRRLMETKEGTLLEHDVRHVIGIEETSDSFVVEFAKSAEVGNSDPEMTEESGHYNDEEEREIP
ncbi:MAG: DUF2945 domain-containing protein, partial [Marivivens sp.]|nr:DUF2945 domain-containing protein [Marivivens sp.]